MKHSHLPVVVSAPRPSTGKAFASASAALAVTAAFAWSFVHTTSVERLPDGAAGSALSAALDLAGAAAGKVAGSLVESASGSR